MRATEGFTAKLKGLRRSVVPVYSLMVATEPLEPSSGRAAGLERRQTFSDMRHLVIYGQRTADDRIAFGGRGAPYHFGSAIEPGFDQDVKCPRSDPQHARRPVPGPREHGDNPCLGRPSRHNPRLAPIGRPRPCERHRVGGRLCRRRCVYRQPRGPHPRRPDSRARHRPGPPSLGGTHSHRSGSPSRCAGSASMPHSDSRRPQTEQKRRPGDRHEAAPCSSALPGPDRGYVRRVSSSATSPRPR